MTATTRSRASRLSATWIVRGPRFSSGVRWEASGASFSAGVSSAATSGPGESSGAIACESSNDGAAGPGCRHAAVTQRVDLIP